MPTDPETTRPKALAWWIDKLVDALEREPATALRIRHVVGHQRARVQLDAEAVIVEFDAAGQLLLRKDDTSIQVDGDGFATREEVCAILKAKSEAGEAVLSGRVAVRGPTNSVGAMLHAIEILLDGAARIPLLRQLAEEFIADTPMPQTPSAPDRQSGPTERDMLGTLDLLP
jgi:hypothetical protein